MSSGENPNDVFDIRKLRRLINLMHEFDLTELDLCQGETQVRLRRGSAPVVSGAAPALAPAGYSPPPAAAPAAPAASGKAVDDSSLHVVRSPMVGTFYAAPSPDAPPYVKVGDHVSRDSTVCLVEAMKVFNEIQAEVTGQVVAVLVEPGEPVEFGQPLFKVDTSK